MASMTQRIVLDCTVAVKWKILTEPHSVEARELLLDLQAQVVEVCVPDVLMAEIMSAFLRAYRRGRISESDAYDAVAEHFALPIVPRQISVSLASRALTIAVKHQQGAFDCLYVALAEDEGIELWTGDQRLFNALNAHFPFIRWIGDYRKQRP